jgi:hypothetical protein
MAPYGAPSDDFQVVLKRRTKLSCGDREQGCPRSDFPRRGALRLQLLNIIPLAVRYAQPEVYMELNARNQLGGTLRVSRRDGSNLIEHKRVRFSHVGPSRGRWWLRLFNTIPFAGCIILQATTCPSLTQIRSRRGPNRVSILSHESAVANRA